MITVPVYELLLLPGVTFFFKKDMFPKGKITEDNIGEEILFVMQKEEMPPEEISMETIYPVGVLGTIDSIDEEGSIKVTTKCRVQVTSVEYSENEVWAEATDRPDVMDVSEEEEKTRFEKIKKRTDGFCKGLSVGRLGAQYDLSLEELFGGNQRFGWLYESFLG